VEALIVLLLAFPIAVIAAVVMAIGTRNRLYLVERRLMLLERRLDGLQVAAVAPSPPHHAAPEHPTTPERPAAPEPQAPEPQAISGPPPGVGPPPSPQPPASPAAAPRPDRTLPPTPASGPARPAMGLEERFGTQWVVWVGGLALALGGFFLVRYSIQQGLVGPGVRVTLGALLAIALVMSGEWARRNEQLSGVVGLPSAHIPSTLTAVGTTIAYADVYTPNWR
jgi:uncharacterized membrane protein